MRTKTSIRIINKILLTGSILFAVGFVISILGMMFIPTNSKFENPIINVARIQVNQHQIEIYNSAYKSIQVYDLKGNFIRKTKYPFNLSINQTETNKLIHSYPFEIKLKSGNKIVHIKQAIWRYFTFPITNWIFLAICWIPFLILNYSKISQLLKQKRNLKELLSLTLQYLKS